MSCKLIYFAFNIFIKNYVAFSSGMSLGSYISRFLKVKLFSDSKSLKKL